jgi:hypothetical protein
VKCGEHQGNSVIRPSVAIDDQAMLTHDGSIDEPSVGGGPWRTIRERAWYALGTRYNLMISAAVLCGDPSRRLVEEE